MPEENVITSVPIRDNSPVSQTYRQSIKKSAYDLPPAPDLSNKSLPTDEQVLGKTNTTTPLETSIIEKVIPDTEVDVDTNETTEDNDPIIEPITPEINEAAEKAKEAVVEEKIKEFDIDNEEDSNFLKELYKEDNTPSVDAEGKPVATKEKTSKVTEVELEERYKPYKEKAAEYEAVLADPMAKAFIEYLKSGKRDPNEFAKEAGFLNVESMTPEQIMEIDFKNEGLTAEETAQELEAFEGLSPYEKKKRANSVKSELIQKRDEKLKTFTAGNEKAQKIHQQAVQHGMAQLNDLIPKMEGRKYEGLLITPDMANRIKQHVISYPEPMLDEKGQFIGYDIKESVSTAVAKLFKNEWKKSLVELGKSLGADKALTARIRPNKKVATSAVLPVHQKTFDDVAKEHSDKQWAQRLGKSNIKK